MNDILRILLIDDDEVDRMAIHRHLSKSDLQTEVVEAENAAAAKQHLQSGDFNCIFLDFRLPDTDGIALVKELRASGILLPIIVLTGQGDEQTAVELMKAGASDYLSKSRLSKGDLTSALRNVVRVYRAEQRTRAAQEQLRQTNKLLKQQNQELEDQRQQIERQNLKLLEASRHKSEFLATVTHELRTPLNSIIGFSQILKSGTKGPLNQYQSEMVNRIFSNGEDLLNLVNDILDMSTIEANRMELKPQTFNLNALMHETIAELKLLAEKKGLDILYNTNLTNKTVYNDRQRLKQVLLNLVSNAIKFTETGYVKVEINALASNSLEIIVEDTGIGISKEQLRYIFNPFKQGDQTTKRRYPGTGLGLAICHSLVSMMEGWVTVSSEVGKGSVFRIRIPQRVMTADEKSQKDLIQMSSHTNPTGTSEYAHDKSVRAADTDRLDTA